MSHETAILTSDKLAAITDNYMKERLSQVKPFTAVILKKGRLTILLMPQALFGNTAGEIFY